MQRLENTSVSKKDRKKPFLFERVLGIPYYVVLILLIVLPIILIFLYAFQDADPNETFFINFTFNNFLYFFREQSFIRVMLESLYLAFLATFLTLLIGYPLAYIISQAKPKNQAVLILLVTAPMWVNMLLRANALEQIFRMVAPNLLGSNFAIIVGMIYVFLPFMVLPIYTVLSKLDKNLLESASDLGANKIQTFLKVIFPLSLSGVLSGIMMVFLPAATTLVIPKYLGNNRFMIGNLIENNIKNGYLGQGAAIAIVLALTMMIFVYMIKRVERKQGGIQHENE